MTRADHWSLARVWVLELEGDIESPATPLAPSVQMTTEMGDTTLDQWPAYRLTRTPV